MADPAQNRTDIEALTAKLGELETKSKTLEKVIGKRKLPAKAPQTFHYGQQDFKNFAKTVHNYLRTMGVPKPDRVQCLLTYLDAKAYMLLTRVYTVDELTGTEYDIAVANIAKILTQKLSITDATKKLMNMKQGSIDLVEFITEIERMGILAFPDTIDDTAKEKCMITALISGVRNSHMSFELQKFQGESHTAKNFSEICLKAIQLDAMLSKETPDDIREDELVLMNDGEPTSCWVCGSLDHLKKDCPNDRRIHATFDDGFMGYFVCEDCGTERSMGRDPGEYPEDYEYYDDHCHDDRYNYEDNTPKGKQRLQKREQGDVHMVGVVTDDTLQEEPVFWQLDTDPGSKDISNEDRM